MAISSTTGFGTTPKKPKKTVKIKLPGDPGYVAPSGSTGGIPVVPTVNKITSMAKPVNPNPNPVMPAGTGIGGQGLSAASAVNPQSSNFSAASQQVGDRVPRDQQASMNTGGWLNPMSGFAKRYDPSQANAIYGNPGMILEDVLRDQGAPISNSRLAGMGNYAGQMKDVAGLIALLQGTPPQDEGLINTIAELIQNGMGAGGGSVDMMTALTALMNPEGGGALDKYLYGAPGDISFGLSDQDSMLQPLFQAAISGVNPYTQQAMASSYRGATNLASQGLAKGDKDPRITQYLRDNLRGIVPGSAL